MWSGGFVGLAVIDVGFGEGNTDLGLVPRWRAERGTKSGNLCHHGGPSAGVLSCSSSSSTSMALPCPHAARPEPACPMFVRHVCCRCRAVSVVCGLDCPALPYCSRLDCTKQGMLHPQVTLVGSLPNRTSDVHPQTPCNVHVMHIVSMHLSTTYTLGSLHRVYAQPEGL